MILWERLSIQAKTLSVIPLILDWCLFLKLTEGLDMQDFEGGKVAFTCQMNNLYPYAYSYLLSLPVNLALVLYKGCAQISLKLSCGNLLHLRH